MSKCKFCGSILRSEEDRLNHIELHLEQVIETINKHDKSLKMLNERTAGSILIGTR